MRWITVVTPRTGCWADWVERAPNLLDLRRCAGKCLRGGDGAIGCTTAHAMLVPNVSRG